jgi:hypothetical protein
LALATDAGIFLILFNWIVFWPIFLKFVLNRGCSWNGENEQKTGKSEQSAHWWMQTATDFNGNTICWGRLTLYLDWSLLIVMNDVILLGALWSWSSVCSFGKIRKGLCNCYWRHGFIDFWFQCPVTILDVQWGQKNAHQGIPSR